MLICFSLRRRLLQVRRSLVEVDDFCTAYAAIDLSKQRNVCDEFC